MAAKWHYSQNGESLGPVTEGELKELFGQGKVHATDLVWCEGMEDWVPLAKVKGLVPAKPTGASYLSAVLGLLLSCVLVISSVATWRFVFSKISSKTAAVAEPQISEVERATSVEQMRREISECRWWSTRPTDREIDALRDAIVALGAGETLWVDDSGQFVSTPSSVHEFPKQSLKPRAASTRRLWIRVPGEQRKTSDEAIGLLRNAVMTANLAGRNVPEGAEEVAKGADPNVANTLPGWKLFSARDLLGSQGLDVTESIVNDHPQHGVTAVYTVAGRDFFSMAHEGKWSAIRFEILLERAVSTLRTTTNGQVMTVGHLIRPNQWSKVEIVRLPNEQKLVCLVNGMIAERVALGNVADLLRMKISSEKPTHGEIEVRTIRVFTEPVPPADLVAAATPKLVPEPEVKIVAPGQPEIAMPEPADALKPQQVVQNLPDDPIPIEFQMYFKRVAQYRTELIDDLDQKISDLEITLRGAKAGQRKAEARVTLNQAKDSMAELKRSKVYPPLPVPAQVGDIGSLHHTQITAVLDNRSAIARFGNGRSYHITNVDAKPLKSGQTIDVADCWEVVGIGAASDDVRRRTNGEVAVLKPIRKAELERYRAMYVDRNTPKPRAKGPNDPVVAGAIPADLREYFARADENHKQQLKAIDDKITELQSAIDDINTLPVDKAAFRQELILVRAKLGTLKNSKPTASLTSRPKNGEFGTLQSVVVVARHDEGSVIAAVPRGPAYRLTEVDPKSLKMRPKVPVDDDEVWQVLAPDEKPTDAIVDLIKADALTVLKLIKKEDIDAFRIAYEAEKKAPEAP